MRAPLRGRVARAVRRLPRPRTLRARLTFGLVVLLAVSCAAVGLAAVVELSGFLTQRLDEQLVQVGTRFPASLEHNGRLPDDHDGDEHGDTRRQPTGTFGARLVNGTVTNKGLVRSGDLAVDLKVDLTAADMRKLAAVPVDGRPHTVDLSSLDDYRVVATRGLDRDVLIVGLPFEPVEAAVHRLELVSAIVFGLALAVAGVTGALWVRWSLRPLSRVGGARPRGREIPRARGGVGLAPAR
ncbi:two-component sensor histidine kinase, partial [Streptomyces sp. NPDC058964]